MFGVLLLVLAIWIIAYATIELAARTDGRVALDDLSTLLMLVFVLYLTLSPLFWLFQGGIYVSEYAGRLYEFQPIAAEQQSLLALALACSVSTLAGYALLRRRIRPFDRSAVPAITNLMAYICVAIIVANSLLLIGLQVLGVIREAESYIDTYAATQEAGLGLRQLLKIVGGVSFFAKIVLLLWIFQGWRARRWLLLLYVAVTLVSFDAQGGRAGLVMMFIAMFILAHRYVRPFTRVQFALIGLSVILGFLALGVYRSFANIGFAGLNVFDFGAGEFDAVWANAIEIQRLKTELGLEPPSGSYLTELLGFVPGGLLWFDKVPLADWYVQNFYPDYAAAGGGWAFGLLPQIVVGLGFVEAIMRGLILGMLAAWMTAISRRPAYWWQYPAQLFFLVWLFEVARNSAFALVTPAVQIVAIGAVIIGGLHTLLSLNRQGGATALATHGAR
jgi:hypothetical protein